MNSGLVLLFFEKEVPNYEYKDPHNERVSKGNEINDCPNDS